MMWHRIASERIRDLAGRFPGVLILGARQVGKTTLAKAVFPNAAYCDLEEPHTRELFSDSPVFQIKERSKSKPLILDEAQAVPDVFPALRGIIDEDRKRNGRFIILGSAQPALIKHVSESLTGRIGALILDPLATPELREDAGFDYRQHWLKGGFPDAYSGDFREWWDAYLTTFLDRDLPALGIERDPLLARRILQYLAHLHGQTLNASSIGNDLGVSYHTVNRYIGIFENTFLIRRLNPYFRNIGKRLTKSPKLYVRDSGLLHHLLNVSSLEQLDSMPGRGSSWEGYVIEEILRREALRQPSAQAYFWRTAAGAEADLILDTSEGRYAYEIKSARGDKPGYARRLESVRQDTEANRAWIIDQSSDETPLLPYVSSIGFEHCLQEFPHITNSRLRIADC